MDDKWKTFDVPEREQDLVLLLFDMMYEKGLVFTKQYWMGEGGGQGRERERERGGAWMRVGG